MAIDGDISSEGERLEQLRESMLGQLDELVAEAEDLVEAQGEEVIEENAETAQLWEELREAYAAAARDLELKRENLGGLEDVLHADLDDLKSRAEKVFGAKLVE